ncbi:MFS transporter [Cardiobacteriaceae bacterium TAE3-ERU3]|nr:MFS transporter [Cardiobacteriaceae bacterium TAE3-ERU3]
MMKQSFFTLQNKNISYIWLFSICLYTGMWLSKYFHPLLFNAHDALKNFGISYSVMAMTGAFSFFYGKIIAKHSLQKGLFVGCILYSIGMFLRIYTDLTASIFSGMIAGMGASISLICLSSWPFSETAENARNKLFEHSLHAANMARGLIVTIVGVIFISLTELIDVKKIMIMASLLPITGFILCRSHIPNHLPKKIQQKTASIDAIKKTGVLHLCIYSVISGFCTSFIIPYLPILLEEQAISGGQILIVLGVSSLITATTQPYIVKQISNRKITHFFLISTIFLGTSTFLLVISNSGILPLAMIITLRFISANAVFYTQRVIEMRLVDNDRASERMGLIQSAFLIGDMFGGGIAGIFWSTGQIKFIIMAIGIFIIINGIYLLKVYKHYKKHEIKEATSI